MNISILITGSEFSLGLKTDSNSKLLANLLRPYSLEIKRIMIVEDKQTAITEALTYLSNISDAIIVSGGLGPTDDDLTREAVAELLNSKLISEQSQVTRIESIFRTRNRQISKSNYKQALFPENVTIIDNQIGTACGFLATYKKTQIYCLPGVPIELEEMTKNFVLPNLLKEQPLFQKKEFQALRIFGLTESNVGEIIAGLNLDKRVNICYQASFPEVQVIASSDNQEALYEAITSIESSLGQSHIFSRDLNKSLENIVHDLLLSNNLSLSLAESCTGGYTSWLITSNAGSSQYFLGSAITYSNELKHKLLNVASQTLDTHGAVSAETACEMAIGARKLSNSSIALSITGIAGPGGGSTEKPVGTFYIGISSDSCTTAYKNFFLRDRIQFQRYAAYAALDILRRYILKQLKDE